jgi:transcriptional regulator with XRE-family HTH domain
MKRKAALKLPPLSAAVKRTREAFGDTQERFARRIDVAVMTVSRFETGRAEPREPRILMRLINAAREIDLMAEAKEFETAYLEAENGRAIDRFHSDRAFVHPALSAMACGLAAYSLQQWRLMAAARTAALYYPDRVAAIERAAGPALTLVDSVLKETDETKALDYSALDLALNALAERLALVEIKQGRKGQ